MLQRMKPNGLGFDNARNNELFVTCTLRFCGMSIRSMTTLAVAEQPRSDAPGLS